MPRPRKCRQVCRLPRHDAFAPVGCARSAEAVVITVDEYETIRLIDYEGLSQEECAASMGVARTTVQQIYNTAREKLSAALGGAALPYSGGRLPAVPGRPWLSGLLPPGGWGPGLSLGTGSG